MCQNIDVFHGFTFKYITYIYYSHTTESLSIYRLSCYFGCSGLCTSAGSLGGMSGSATTAAAGFQDLLSTRGLGLGIGGSMRLVVT